MRMEFAARVLFVAAAAMLTAAPAFALRADHRLGHEALPLSESVTLELDAAQKQYSGSVTIDLRVPAATDSFQLHALGLTLTRVTLTGSGGLIPVTFTDEAAHGILTLRAARRLKPGHYALRIEFTNEFDTKANGLYRLDVGPDAYAFTQFEAEGAREAFPCWDEPEFKIPWQLTLVVPKEDLALSNTPIVSETAEGGRRRVLFERTPPMPSYLVALAIGPLETIPITGLGVAGRVVTVKGESGLAMEAAKVAPAILGGLEEYFGFDYPYRKLDLIAVPEFWAGAMENPGAIMFREESLLLDSTAASADQRRRLVSFLAHEMAHMWFGDYVTMTWWDDLWLNESFASWMGNKIASRVAPEFKIGLAEVRSAQRAMVRDALASTRAMRQPVDAFDNLDQLADVLSYDKGQTVLDMIEDWIGPDAFRQGVRAYLRSHPWGSAAGDDLWNSLSKAAGFDVSGAVKSFLDQPGVPLVEAEPQGVSTLRLRQSRFSNEGAAGTAPESWQIPVALRYSDGTGVRTQTVLLTDSARTVRLESNGTLAWFHPNADERGYYRWSVPAGSLTTLADMARLDLTPRERVGFVGNLIALLDAGRVHGDETLRLLMPFGSDSEPGVVSEVMESLDRARTAFVTPQLRDAFAEYVRRTLGPVWNRIGPSKRQDEAETVSLLRPRLMQWLGEWGRDAAVLQRADTLARAYLADPASVEPALAGTALALAATRGDAPMFETFRERFEKSTLPADRERFLYALGCFRDTALVSRALAYALTSPVRPQEIFTIVAGVQSAPENEDRLFAWVRWNYDAISARIPAYVAPYLVEVLSGCSAERLESGRAFFSEPAHVVAGTERELARVTDEVRHCVGLREREGAAVARYLTTLAGAR